MTVLRISDRPRLVVDEGPVLRIGGSTTINVDGSVTVVEPGGGVSLPIAQSDVTGLVSALAGKASATMSVGGALSGALPNPGLNTEALQDAVGAMAGDGLTYDDTAGELNVVAPAHSIAWCIVADTFDPTVTPLPVTTSTNLYICTGVEADTYPHAGLWRGTSTDGSPALLERHPHTVTTGDLYTSRTLIDLRSGSIEVPTSTPPGGGFPDNWVSPQRVDAIISGNNGPNLPVWSLVVEQDRNDGEALAPSIDFLADVDTTTVAPTSGDVLSWDGTNWVPDAAAGGGTVDVVSNVATSRLLGRVTAGSGDSEELTAAQVRTLLNVADGATAYTDEQARDALGAALTAGAGITITPNDGADTITVASSITQYTDEAAQDAAAAALVTNATHTRLTAAYVDGSNAINLTVPAGVVWGHGAGSAVTATSATTLLSATGSLPALAVGDALQLIVDIDALNNSGSGRAHTITVVWGNATIAFLGSSMATSGTARPMRLQLDARVNSTNSVRLSGILTVNAGSTVTVMTGTSTSDHSVAGVSLDIQGTVAAGGSQSLTLQAATLRRFLA